MEVLLLLSLSMLWGMLLVNLALTIRILRWIRAANEAHMVSQKPVEERQPLVVGAPALEFKARTLAGQATRLDDYAERAIAFIFVSPACGHCRMEMPMLIKLAPLARKNGGVEIILVSDWGPVVTQQWLDTIRDEDGVDVRLPVLVAPRGKTDFLDDYNPKSMTPAFCLLSPLGTIQQAVSLIPSPAWNKLKHTWEGISTLSPFMYNRSQ